MALDCTKFNSYLFRRTPDFDKELAKDRFPYSYTYAGLYPTKTWESFTGTTHTWDQVHVTTPNDDGCWDEVSIGTGTATECGAQCDPTRLYTGWGSTRSTYNKAHRDYQSPVFCYDQLRHVEEARAQLSAIIEGHKRLPNQIVSDYLRLRSVRDADVIYVCDTDLDEIEVTSTMWEQNCSRLNTGSASKVPASKLSMQYLNHYVPRLMYNGYADRQFVPDTKFTIMTDMQTALELCNANPALTQMYNAADFAKGGKFFQYGAMLGCGNFLFKIDPTPLRFIHLGAGLMLRVYPFENVSATVGKKMQFDTLYENADYQLSHVYNTAARQVFVGDTSPVSPDMPFLSRDLQGKWSWKSPDYFKATDPNTGGTCEYMNDKKNKGYFLAEFEFGVKTVFPKIEQWILHKRESQGFVNVARGASAPTWSTAIVNYQDLKPYNTWCEQA